MNVAAVTVGAYDNAGLSIQGLRASRGEDPCAVSIPAASTFGSIIEESRAIETLPRPALLRFLARVARERR
jgi:hypothetical protein